MLAESEPRAPQAFAVSLCLKGALYSGRECSHRGLMNIPTNIHDAEVRTLRRWRLRVPGEPLPVSDTPEPLLIQIRKLMA